jgi:hypothetical protein
MNSVSPEDPASLRLQAMLAEYQMLRQESLEAISNRLTVMSFTFAALSVLVAGLLTAKTDALTGAIALVFLPQLSKAALLIWLGEYARSQRAGRFIAQLERRINAHVGEDAVTWETHLATRPPGAPTDVHMSFPYVAVVVILLGVGYAGAILGAYFVYHGLHRELSDGSAVLVLGGLADLVIIFEAWFLRFFFREWRKAAVGQAVTKPRRLMIPISLVLASTAAAVALYLTHVDATNAKTRPLPGQCPVTRHPVVPAPEPPHQRLRPGDRRHAPWHGRECATLSHNGYRRPRSAQPNGSGRRRRQGG